MAIHNESRKLNYSCQQVFSIIADVECYPEFLPLWQQVHVYKKKQINDEHFIYHTRQSIQLGPVSISFNTETHLFPSHCIKVESSDSLFKKFNMQWLLSANKEDQCTIDFSINCMASSIFMRPIFDTILLQASQSIISAFERRIGFINCRNIDHRSIVG